MSDIRAFYGFMMKSKCCDKIRNEFDTDDRVAVKSAKTLLLGARGGRGLLLAGDGFEGGSVGLPVDARTLRHGERALQDLPEWLLDEKLR